MTTSVTTTVQVFDPAMCCPTGVCGPSVDPALVRFAADLEVLRGRGIQVERFNLSQEPAAFVANEAVKSALQADANCLPLILADGRVVARGRYPATRQELLALLGLEPVEETPVVQLATAEGGCCDPASGCC